MAVAFTANSAAGTSCTIPTHAVGDTIILHVYRDGSTTTPTKPSAGGTVPAWNDIDNGSGANTNSSRTAYFIATATNHTTGTWTNATGVTAIVATGANATNPIGAHSEAGGASANAAQAPAITLINNDGTSGIVRCYGHRTVTAWSAAPGGYTRLTSVATEVACNSQNTTTTSAAVNQTNTASNSGYRGATIEVFPPFAKTGTLTDTFATQDSAKWVYPAAISATGGQAVINTSLSSTVEILVSKARYDLTGSAAFVEVVQATPIGNGTPETAFSVTNTNLYGNNAFYFWLNNGNLYFYEDNGGAETETHVTYNSTTHRWWRIRESSGTVFWDTSEDGVTWTNRRSKTAAWTGYDNARVDIAAGGGTVPSGTAIFDNFNISQITGDASLAVTASPTAAAGFGVGGTLAATATPSGAVTNSGVVAASLTETATATAAVVRTHNASASLTVTATPTSAASAAFVADAALVETASPTGAATRTHTAEATLEVTAAPAAAVVRTHNAAAALAITGSQTGVAAADFLADSTTTVTAAPTGAGERTRHADTNLTVTASPTGAGNTDANIASDLEVTASAEGGVQRGHNTSAALSVTATPSGAVTNSTTAAAALAITAGVSAAGDVEAGGTDVTADAALTVTAGPSAAVVYDTTTTTDIAVTAGLTGAATRGHLNSSTTVVTADVSASAEITKHVDADLGVTGATAAAATRSVTADASLNVSVGRVAGADNGLTADTDLAVAVIAAAEAVVSSAIQADLALQWAVRTAFPPPAERINTITPDARRINATTRAASLVVESRVPTLLVDPDTRTFPVPFDERGV